MNKDTPTPNSTASKTATPYWFESIHVLLNLDTMNQALPSKEMTYAEKVNALVRLSWYIGIIASLVTFNVLYLYIPVVTMLVTYVLYLFRDQEQKTAEYKKKTEAALAKVPESVPEEATLEKFADYIERENTTPPSEENPFMNPMPFDRRDRSPAVPLLSNPVNRANVEVLYDKGNWRDVNDVWDRNNGKRQFFTMPWTTYPNDQGSFANWLYKTPATCKEGNGDQCVANVFDINTSNRVAGGVVSGVFH